MPRMGICPSDAPLAHSRHIPHHALPLRTHDVAILSARQYFWLASSLALSPPAYMLGVLGSHLGLTWKWSVLASFLSALLAAGLAALTMHAPSKYGIPFCVSARTSFGIFGAKIFSLLHLGLAFPWTAWLLSIATEGLREGITRFRPSVATWNPLPPSFLPPGQSSLLSLLCLASSFLLLVSLHAFGKIQALRSLAPVLSTLLLAFYVGLGIWAYRLLGLDTGLHAYDAKVLPASLPPSPPLPLYTSLPLAVLLGLGAWTTPLLLGWGDLSRWCSLRPSPRHALLVVFPLLSPLTTFLGCFLTGTVARGWSTVVFTPTALLSFLSPPYMALLGGIGLWVATLHTAVVGYLLPGAHALSNVLGPRLLANTGVAGGCLGFGAFLFVLLAPSTVLTSRDAHGGSAFVGGSLLSGLVGGALVGVLLSDIFWVRQAVLPVHYLYKTTPRLHKGGVNVGAILAVLAGGAVFGFPSLWRTTLPASTGGYGAGAGSQSTIAATELLGTMGFLLTFPLSFVLYAVTYPCFTAPRASLPSSLPPPPSHPPRNPRRERNRGVHMDPGSVAATGAGAPDMSADVPPAPGPPFAPPPRRPLPSPESASSRATEALTATLQQLLLYPVPPATAPARGDAHPPPSPTLPVPTAPLHPESEGWVGRRAWGQGGGNMGEGYGEAREGSLAGVGTGGGWEEETKMEGGEGRGVPRAYAVVVHKDDEASK